MVAKWLRVSEPDDENEKAIIESEYEPGTMRSYFEYDLSEHSSAIGKRILNLRLPKKSFITMILRKGEYFIPDGNTVLLANDKLYFIANKDEEKDKITKVLG